MKMEASVASVVRELFHLNAKQMQWDVAACTDTGRVRPMNEDSYRISAEQNLFVLSDGLGGAAKGEVASAMAVESVVASMQNDSAAMPGEFVSRPELTKETNLLVRAVESANRQIHEQGMREPACRGMGATIVAAHICGRRLSLVHVGDSRAYLFRAGTLQQLTSDHSLVAEQVRHGLMSHQQAAVSELQSVLTRALGTEQSVEVDAAEIELFPRDSLLLCSDGLTRMVPENEIAEILVQAPGVGIAAERLVNRANECGGHDNITVVVIRIKKSLQEWFATFFPWCGANLV
ncbi:MAG: Stp1/IreP family PP2C-type Ser/Thr phosphatase [Acidobacteria bacterium]|nr:MAG: Stp1/IreP family PP2C-type Ser/Thr phosphatase [Acidobacteriota bacterium]